MSVSRDSCPNRCTFGVRSSRADGTPAARFHRRVVPCPRPSSAGRLMNEPVAEIARMLHARPYGAESQTPLTEIEALVVAEAVSGTVRAALLRNPSVLKSAAFEQALFDLAVGFLRRRRTRE